MFIFCLLFAIYSHPGIIGQNFTPVPRFLKVDCILTLVRVILFPLVQPLYIIP